MSQPTIKETWFPLLEVVHQLSIQPYTDPTGQTIFQQICYIMTEMGLQTGFTFQLGSYGLFSPEFKPALALLTEAGLIHKKEQGSTLVIETGPAYANQQAEITPKIAPFEKEIDKTVDLFCRIKSTAQAEEVTSVLFAARKLKKEGRAGAGSVSEQDVLDFVLRWKKRWDKPEKIEAVVSAIRHLQMLGWVKLVFSPEIKWVGDG